MNLLLFKPEELQGQQVVVVSDYRFRHLRDVHRAAVADTVRVGEVGGLWGSAVLTAMTDDSATLEVSLEHQPPPKLPLTLILALPRPKMLRRILRSVAEYGVSDLVLINASRVEKSFWQTPVLEAPTVEHYFRQGLEQARDTVLPTLHIAKRFKPFVEDELPTLLTGKKAYVAHPGLGRACPHATQDSTVLVIGPEGGFIPYEVELLQAAGCEGIHLGPRILRVENAVSVLIAKLYE